MTGRTIEARLRLAADLAAGIKALRELKREALDTREAVADAGTGAAGTGPDAATGREAERAAKRAQLQAERQAAREAREATRQQRAQELADARSARQAQTANARQQRDEQRAQQRAERDVYRQRVQQEQMLQREVRASANLQRQAYRQLPAQVTDIATSIASGLPIWMVAIQQGGQLRDSWGGIVPAGRALLSLITPVRVAIGGLAGVVAALSLGFLAGYRESDRLRKSLALTGQQAETSLGAIDAQARSIAASTGAAIGGVRDVLEALLGTGQQTGSTLDSAARAVIALRRLTGESAEEAIKLFDGQAESVTQWAIKQNRAYRFLTAADVDYIRSLQAQGRQAEAVRFANQKLADTLTSRAVPAIGALEKAWKGVSTSLGEVWDWLKKIGRDETAEERIAKLQRRVELSQRQRQNARVPGGEQLEQALGDVVRNRNMDQLRQAEAGMQWQQELVEIERRSRQFQAALAGVNEAAARQRLAQLQAALDREAALVERADAQGLLTAEDKALKLNAIEQRRLAAQAQLLQRQIELEKGKAPETEIDALNQQAAVKGLEAQLVDVQAKIRVAQSEALGIVDRAALERARQQAQDWAEVWKRTYDANRELAQQNARATADTIAEPAERAAAAARIATEDLRRQAQEIQRDLDTQIALTPEGGMRDELVRLRAENDERSRAAIAETGRQASLASLREQAAEQTEALRLAEQALDQQVERGALTAEQAERRKFEARRQAIPQLERIQALLALLAANPGEINAVRQLAQEIAGLGVQVSQVEGSLRSSLGSGFRQFFMDVVTGAKSAGDAFRDFVANIARAALDMIAQRLGARLAESLLPTGSLSGGGGGGGGWIVQLGKWFASLFHSGGVVGHSAAPLRAVSPLLLAGAQVLHAGGIAGDEQLAVLKKGEEVLTERDPRHVWNGGGAGPVIGELHVSVSIPSGTGGNPMLGDQLARGMKGAMESYVLDQMRPGGLLEGVRRGRV